MKTEKEIKELIEKITKDYQHVLDCKVATIDSNAPRALMQLTAKVELVALCWVLGKKRPRFKCDDKSKVNM